MLQLVLIPFLAMTVALLIRAEFRHDRRQTRVFKPASTLLVIAIAALSLWTPGTRIGYTVGILVGLILSMGGDIALMFAGDKMFRVGLILFLLAHIAYAVTFTAFSPFYAADLISGVILLMLGIVIYRYLEPNLNGLKGPVILYMVFICLMVNRAISTFFGTSFTATQSWLVSVGATLFWISDLILAAARFGHPWKYHRISLAFYYSGQLLIALSPSF
jgi:uncharacterized membrane protein YhhN